MIKIYSSSFTELPEHFQVGAVAIGSTLQRAAHLRTRQDSRVTEPALPSVCQPAECLWMERQQMTTYPLAKMMQATKNGFCERWLQCLHKKQALKFPDAVQEDAPNITLQASLCGQRCVFFADISSAQVHMDLRIKPGK